MPSTLIGLALIVIAVLPGSMYTWAYERQASAYGVTFADRTLRFTAISLIFHIALGWPEWLLYRSSFKAEKFETAQFAILWVGVLLLVVVPAAIGTVLGGLYATRTNRVRWTRLRKHLTPEKEQRLLTVMLGRTPAPRAWDDLFSDSPYSYLRVRLTDDTVIAGLFASESYAGGHPHETDLLLEDMWKVGEDGETLEKSLGYPVYIAASQIAWIEVVPQQTEGEENQ